MKFLLSTLFAFLLLPYGFGQVDYATSGFVADGSFFSNITVVVTPTASAITGNTYMLSCTASYGRCYGRLFLEPYDGDDAFHFHQCGRHSYRNYH